MYAAPWESGLAFCRPTTILLLPIATDLPNSSPEEPSEAVMIPNWLPSKSKI